MESGIDNSCRFYYAGLIRRLFDRQDNGRRNGASRVSNRNKGSYAKGLAAVERNTRGFGYYCVYPDTGYAKTNGNDRPMDLADGGNHSYTGNSGVLRGKGAYWQIEGFWVTPQPFCILPASGG